MTKLLAFAVILAAGSLALVRYAPASLTALAGALLVIVAVPLLVAARRQLGSSFAVTPKAKALVTTGLYARIPHPMYVFLDLALLGVVIMTRRAWLLAVPAALAAAQTWQARREARVLEERFGDAYREYRKRTWW